MASLDPPTPYRFTISQLANNAFGASLGALCLTGTACPDSLVFLGSGFFAFTQNASV